MNRHAKQMSIVAILAICVLGVAYAVKVTPEAYCGEIRTMATEWGIDMSNVWLRIDGKRQTLYVGGKMASVSDVHAFFRIVNAMGTSGIEGNKTNIEYVSQCITVASGVNPYTNFFAIGYTPSAKPGAKPRTRPVRATPPVVISVTSTNEPL